MSEISLDSFADPGISYRGKTFWSWNGKLDKEELLRQMSVIKDMGMGGFFMHSRTGLVTEYLGEEWFELINTCADEAEKMGLEAWLYDEDRWPSGTAGGMVTEDPRFRLKFIYLDVIDSADFIWNEQTLAAFACRLNGFEFRDSWQITEDTSADQYEGSTILAFSIREMNKSSFYNGHTYVDTMNREATEYFIQLTHEKYKSNSGERLGRAIKGIFTDEPHRGPLMEVFSISNERGEWHAPWTEAVFERFQAKFGYDLIPRLPELFLQKDGVRVSQVKWHYVEMLQELFLENFVVPINEWCEANGLELTGHFLHEDNLTAQTAMAGSMMRLYEHMSYPGVDVLTEGNRNFWIVKQLASAARQFGKKWMTSELYGCTGWQFTFENHKSVGDWQALFGINLRCHHLSWYSMEGEAKRDYPASIFYQSAWWKDYKFIEDYYARIGWVMSQGKPICDILVLNPVESVWCQVYPGWSNWLQPQSKQIEELEETYKTIFHWLSGAQLDFDYGDEEILGRLYQIKIDSEGTPWFTIGEADYKVIVVGGMLTMRASTLLALKEFIAVGGKVIFAGELPEYVDALPDDAIAALAEQAFQVPMERKSLVEICRAHTKPLFELKAVSEEDQARLKDIFGQLRKEGNDYYLMLINVNREQAIKNISVRFLGEGYMEEWHCTTGERSLCGAADFKGLIEITADFSPSGEHLYRITPQLETALHPIKPLEIVEEKLLGQTFRYELDEPNVCLLDRAAYCFAGSSFSEEKEVLRIDRELRSQLGMAWRGGEMLQPWFAQKSEHPLQGELELSFNFYIEQMIDTLIELVLETPEAFHITINGAVLEASGSSDWWVDPCFRKIPIPQACLDIGKNTILLKTQFHEGMNLEALYLIGDFKVTLDGTKKKIAKLPEQIQIGDLVEQGFPFYGAGVTYKLPVIKPLSEGQQIFIAAEQFSGAFVKAVNQVGNVMLAWQPYEADITDMANGGAPIDLVIMLTRRNTFGPHHQIPVLSPAYSPDSFHTQGEAYSDAYMLIPSGLLESPKLVIKQEAIK